VRCRRGPVDLLGEFAAAEVDEAAPLDRTIFAVGEPEPLDRSPPRIDDEQLVDVVASVERQLLPGLIVGRRDLYD
jgi:hypothetical protein